MSPPKQHTRQAISKEIYVSVVGWIWVAASLAAVYFLVRAVFFGDGWWPIVASVAAAWFLYKVSLYYVLEKSGQLKAAAEVRSPPLKNDLPKSKPPVSGAEVPAKGGTTPESAIRIHAANSLVGIPKEYPVLKAMFGAPNQDWKLIERSLLDTDDGRRLEKFIISASGKRREIYFDITEWFKGNTSKEAKAALEAIIALQDKPLTIQLPKEEFMTLQMGLLRLTEAQLNQLGLSQADRKSMLDPFLDALKPWHGEEYASIPEHVSVITLISVWSRIMGLLTSWQPADFLQEEELENLKAIISGTMKAARNASRSI
jgi:hypothetical protein